MTLRVIGPRVLIKVAKFDIEAVRKKYKYVEGSTVIERTDVDKIEEQVQSEITRQTVAEVVGIGSTAYTNKQLCPDGIPWVKVGEKIHFVRYGAQRIATDDKDIEYWIINDKDALVVDE
jgi:co-chaperonin GroES (HSP10)